MGLFHYDPKLDLWHHQWCICIWNQCGVITQDAEQKREFHLLPGHCCLQSGITLNLVEKEALLCVFMFNNIIKFSPDSLHYQPQDRWGCGKSCFQLSWVSETCSKHLSSCEVGLSNFAPGCIWTFLAQCLINCIYLVVVDGHTNGLKCFLCPTLCHSALFNNFESSLLRLVFWNCGCRQQSLVHMWRMLWSYEQEWHALHSFLTIPPYCCVVELVAESLSNVPEVQHESIQPNSDQEQKDPQSHPVVSKKAEEWLCVEQSCELFRDIRGRGGASNSCFHT